MDKNDLQYRKTFSQRNGFELAPLPLDPNKMPGQLRLELADALTQEWLDGSQNVRYGGEGADWDKVLGAIWVQKFGRDRTQGLNALCIEECTKVIKCREPHDVLTLIEELAIKVGDRQISFTQAINAALIRHQTSYVLHRISEIGWRVIQTGTEVEREIVIQCLSDLHDPVFKTSRMHFEMAGSYLVKGAYSESANQSAKALEACLCIIVNAPEKWTGGQALEEYLRKFELPRAFYESIRGLWRYRNQAANVGHAEKVDSTTPSPDRWDARFIYSEVAGCLTYLINRRRKREEG